MQLSLNTISSLDKIGLLFRQHTIQMGQHLGDGGIPELHERAFLLILITLWGRGQVGTQHLQAL